MDQSMENPEDKEPEIKWFECKGCELKEQYHFKGSKPKYFRNIIFQEDTYIMKDPFTPPDKKQFLILGSDCYICKKSVCQSDSCSLFFRQRYCQNCAWKNKSIFPQQVQSKIKDPNKN